MRVRRRVTALLAALLLLVPLALRAHVHAGHAASDCGACVVSQHAPTVRDAAPSVTAPTLVHTAVGAPAVRPPAAPDRAVHAGRGPPPLLPSSTA